MAETKQENLLSIAELTFRPLHVDLEFESVTHSVTVGNKQTVIIDNASGAFQHGKLHAIMGPSGCGKSSLLNVLSGFNPVATGTISLNGTRCQISKWASLITPVRSYILQDDFLVNELTVREQLTYAVDLRVPNGTSKEKREQIVNTLIVRTGLIECAHRSISLLSGGQRKRLCVASEFVNYPPVVFLDEPTSGLDSTSCYRLVELLKSLAQAGCNVIATIHQPNSRVFAIFDTLTVLYNGGVVAYSGPAIALADSMQQLNKMTVSHLENPADVLFEGDNIKRLAKVDPVHRQLVIERATHPAFKKLVFKKIISDVTSSCETTPFCLFVPVHRLLDARKSWAKIEGDTEETQSLYEPTAHRKPVQEEQLMDAHDLKDLCSVALPSQVPRFRAVLRRTLVQSRRDMVFLLGRFAAFCFGCGIVALLFQNTAADGGTVFANTTFLFFTLVVYVSGTCICTIMTGQDHLQVFLRDNINSWYGISSFYITRTIIEIAIDSGLAVAFALPLWYMTGQQQDNSMHAAFCIVLIMFIQTQAWFHFSFILAMFVDRPSIPQMPFAIIMLLTLFSGYFIKLKKLPEWIGWIQFVNFPSWAYFAELRLAFGPLKPGDPPVTIPCKSGSPFCTVYKTGYDVLNDYGVPLDGSYWTDIQITLYYAIGIGLASWALLNVYLRNAKRAIARL